MINYLKDLKRKYDTSMTPMNRRNISLIPSNLRILCEELLEINQYEPYRNELHKCISALREKDWEKVKKHMPAMIYGIRITLAMPESPKIPDKVFIKFPEHEYETPVVLKENEIAQENGTYHLYLHHEIAPQKVDAFLDEKQQAIQNLVEAVRYMIGNNENIDWGEDIPALCDFLKED